VAYTTFYPLILQICSRREESFMTTLKEKMPDEQSQRSQIFLQYRIKNPPLKPHVL